MITKIRLFQGNLFAISKIGDWVGMYFQGQKLPTISTIPLI